MESDANSHLTLLPQIIQWGWASENAVDIDSLKKRLRAAKRRDERNSQSSVRPATSVRMGQSAVLVEMHAHSRDAGTRCVSMLVFSMATVHQYDRMMSATHRMGEKNRRCKLQKPSKKFPRPSCRAARN